MLVLRVSNHHTLVRDSLIGEVEVSLAQLLANNEGKLNSVKLPLQLTPSPNAAAQSMYQFSYV